MSNEVGHYPHKESLWLELITLDFDRSRLWLSNKSNQTTLILELRVWSKSTPTSLSNRSIKNRSNFLECLTSP